MDEKEFGVILKNNCQNSESYEELLHWHEGIELIYVLNGKFNCATNKINFDLKVGDICFINQKQLHCLKSNNCTNNCLTLFISTHLLIKNSHLYEKYIFPMVNDYNFSHIIINKDNKYNLVITSCIKQIESLLVQKPCAYELEVVGLIYHMLRYIYCIFKQKETNSISLNIDSDIYLLKKMIEYIQNNYQNNINLNDIAKVGNVSNSKCLRMFKKFTYISPISYLINYRLNIAKDMILNSDNSIADIAYECGFSQQSYFTKMFYKVFKMTPKKYKKENKKTDKDLNILLKDI